MEKENKEEKKNEKVVVETQEKKEESKIEEKTEKEKSDEKPKKTEAIVNAFNLPISTKHSIAICNFVRHKKIDDAISLLEQVNRKKIAVPFRGEIPHRKKSSQRIMSGRYPINASKVFIKLLKTLSANASVNGLDAEKTIIAEAKANLASRPYKRFGSERFKLTNVNLIAREKIK